MFCTFMPSVSQELEHQIQSEEPNKDSSKNTGAYCPREQLKVAVALQRKCKAWLASVDGDPACDYLETRTGCEVILGLEDLEATEYGELCSYYAIG